MPDVNNGQVIDTCSQSSQRTSISDNDEIDSDYKQTVIINEIIAYATFHKNLYPRKAIEDIILQFYSNKEINEAKTILFKEFGEKRVNRRKDPKNVADIFDCLDKLDAAGIEVVAAARNMNRIPRCSPGEMLQLSVLERLSLLEAKMTNVEHAVTEVKVETLLTKDKKNDFPALDEKRPSSEVKCWSDVARVQRLIQDEPLTEPRRGNDDDGFQIPRAQAKKAARKSTAVRPSTGRRTTVVTGTSNSSNVTGAPPPSRDFFLSRIAKSTTSEALKNEIETKGVIVRELVKISRDESKMDSYRLMISVDNVSTIYQPEFWASGIQIRKFFKRNTDNGRI